MTETDTETARCRRKSEKIMKEKPRDRETTKTEREREKENKWANKNQARALALHLGEHSRPAAWANTAGQRPRRSSWSSGCMLKFILLNVCSIYSTLSVLFVQSSTLSVLFVGIIQHSLSALWSHASRNSNSVFKTQATRRVLICGGVNKCC